MVVFAYVITCQCAEHWWRDKIFTLGRLGREVNLKYKTVYRQQINKRAFKIDFILQNECPPGSSSKSVIFSCNRNHLVLGIKHFNSK